MVVFLFCYLQNSNSKVSFSHIWHECEYTVVNLTVVKYSRGSCSEEIFRKILVTLFISIFCTQAGCCRPVYLNMRWQTIYGRGVLLGLHFRFH